MRPTIGSLRSGGANDGVNPGGLFCPRQKAIYELHVNESSHLATQTITTMARSGRSRRTSVARILERW